MQQEFEDLFYKYHVDLALWGHYHSYERTCPVYRQKCTPGGTTNVVVGTAGYVLLLTPFPFERKPWSEYHSVHYGYGRATAVNSTALLWEWVKNYNHEVADRVWLRK
ncbi:predicted protein [Nematostella vectensis]|uniref:Purple acid phosphatase C-terminal domain-containing protein n=2 Tax=Nematostella vectensis TaxID=45351 RepID=A7SZW3_NEMVE|nr:predicted protein [Nematostella vectensis]|eukprot:XP_001622860.1 predicted protein [Nematostella vectensis]